MNLLTILQDIQTEKEKNGIHPSHVTLTEVYRKVNTLVYEKIQELEKKKVVHIGDTVNDKYITINKK